MDTGKRLKEIRSEERVSQMALSKLSGVNVNTIALIEVNKINNPGVNTVEKLMKPLGLTLKDFVK